LTVDCYSCSGINVPFFHIISFKKLIITHKEVTKKVKILLVDDNIESLSALEILLQSHGYDLTSATNGEEALEKALKDTFNVIISDILMPQMDGFELCRTVKTHEKLRHIAFVFYTASYVDPADEAVALSLGADKFVVKTREPGVLLAVLQEVIHAQAAGRLVAVWPSAAEHAVFLEKYNALLIKKLEEKTLELERLNKQLRESEGKYRRLVDDANDAVILVDLQGFLRFVNPKFCALSGYTATEANTLHFSRLLYPEDVAMVTECLHKCLAGDKPPGGYALRWLTKAGQTIQVDMNANVIVREGSIAGMQVIVRDITARKHAEEALRKSEERFAKAFHASPDAITITRLADGRYLDVNARFLNLSGYRRAEVIGVTSLELHRWVNLHDRERVVQRLREHGSVRDFGTQLRCKSGEIREARMSMELMTLDEEPCILSIIHDITERRRLEAQLRQVQKMEAIGTLAGGIAHEFNNILSAILGYTELSLYDVPPESHLWHNLQEVLSAGKRGRDLVQQILKFSRYTEQSRQPVELHLLIQEALLLLRPSLPSTIEITQALDAAVGPVLADPTQIHQVLMNLCANAEYAMRGTGGILEVRLEAVAIDAAFAAVHPELRPGPHVRLTVQDTGHGMAPEIMERIFEPFFTTKGVGEGTGMGLAVVHGIVTSHEGAITVASTLGQGTTFAIYLPKIQEASADISGPDGPIPRGEERILFVDDEAVLAHMGQELLGHLGYRVVVHTSSLEALEDFRAAPQLFDVVITDQTMPHVTGEALAIELRRIRPDVPIILCTGFSHSMTAERAQELGIAAFLMKPLVTRDLALTIRQVLTQRSG
jgi:PAS domain S-box-containing protein